MISKIVVLDLETSGIDLIGNGIVEFRAIVVDLQSGEVISQFNLLTKPESPTRLSKLVEEITGIHNGLLSNAPNNIDALRQFDEFAAGKPIWVYNLPFTSKFLKKVSHKDYELKDILALVREKRPELKNSTLKTAAEQMVVEIKEDLGRMRDCFIAKDILLKVHNIKS